MKYPTRHEYSVIYLCEQLHGAVKGTGDGMPNDAMIERAAWLRGRVNEGWFATDSVYDAAARLLALAVLGEVDDYLKRILK